MTIREFYTLVGGSYDDMSERFPLYQLILRFLTMLPQDGSMELLVRSMDTADAKTAFRAVHTLKGVALNLGLTALAGVCSEMTEALRGSDEQTFLQVFEGVPRFEISRPLIEGGVGFLALCTEHAAVFPSKGEARKLIQGGGVSLNKRKIAAVDCMVGSADLLSGRYLLVQKGKKNYFLIVVTD